MKKILFSALSLCLLLILTGCKQTTSQKVNETMTLTTFNGNKEQVEVEYHVNPQRIAVLDYSALDILDALDLKDNIIGVAKGSTQIEYLQSYMKMMIFSILGPLLRLIWKPSSKLRQI